jgi:hypothetical protein
MAWINSIKVAAEAGVARVIILWETDVTGYSA